MAHRISERCGSYKGSDKRALIPAELSRSVDVVRTRLSALATIRDESSDRKVVGKVVCLLSCTKQFEFVY